MKSVRSVPWNRNELLTEQVRHIPVRQMLFQFYAPYLYRRHLICSNEHFKTLPSKIISTVQMYVGTQKKKANLRSKALFCPIEKGRGFDDVL
jgi:hypothetical protein